MTSPSETDSSLRSLGAPGRLAVVLFCIVLSGLTGCIVHAFVTACGERLTASLAMTRRLQLSDLAVVPNEDLRHPGWGRPEQARAGQPALPDPRAVGILIHPQPVKVIK